MNTTADDIGLTHNSRPRVRDAIRASAFCPCTIEVRPQFEHDVKAAYLEWYRDKLSKDTRPELGRFLFGVSSTTIGLIVALATLSFNALPIGASSIGWLAGSILALIMSAMCGLYLAVPKATVIDPNDVELVGMQRRAGAEMKNVSRAWFILWCVGVTIGCYGLLAG